MARGQARASALRIAVRAPLVNVHGLIGTVQEGLGGVVWRGPRQTDAGTHARPASRGAMLHGIVHVGDERLGPVADGHELVAADASHEHGGAQTVAERLRHLGEHLIARHVTEIVVDRLEPVKIEERHHRVGSLAEAFGESVDDARTVGDAGER